MSKEFKCRWPTGIERLVVKHGFQCCDGQRSIRVAMSIGGAVSGSVHLHADDAIEVAQALAVERAKLDDRVCARGEYACGFFNGVSVSAEPHTDDVDDETVAVRVGAGLAYLSREDAKALAMDLLAMTADDAQG